MADVPKSSPFLRFDPSLAKKDLKKIRDNLSAIVLDGNHLWLGGDEGTRIHRMTRDAAGDYGDHASFELQEMLDLPGPANDEIDIEGMAVDGGCLWLIGSHSAKRKKPEDDRSATENIRRLSEIEAAGNRFTLARVPLDDAATPVAAMGDLTAARLSGDASGDLLTEALRRDPHVGRFVPRVLPDGSIEGIPGKDNGFDVEGLAVTGNRVFLGLRGPVLRGFSLVIELQLNTSGGRTLALDPLGSSERLYLKHFLQLDGLGVRELVIVGDDLLILAGPSMDLDGPVYIYRWKNALNLRGDTVAGHEVLTRVLTVPFGVTKDHAEGLSVATDAPLTIMVCYDSPSPTRIDGGGVKADVFAIEA